MEILKQGKYKTGKIICHECNCEFLYNNNDIKKDEWYRVNTFETKHTHDYVRCPECGYKIVIKIY